jgi:hypothetical protein
MDLLKLGEKYPAALGRPMPVIADPDLYVHVRGVVSPGRVTWGLYFVVVIILKIDSKNWPVPVLSPVLIGTRKKTGNEATSNSGACCDPCCGKFAHGIQYTAFQEETGPFLSRITLRCFRKGKF